MPKLGLNAWPLYCLIFHYYMVLFWWPYKVIHWKYKPFKKLKSKNVEAKTWPKHSPKLAPMRSQNSSLCGTLLFVMHGFSVKVWSVLVFLKQIYGRNGLNMVLIWAKHNPIWFKQFNITWYYSVCNPSLFSEHLNYFRHLEAQIWLK